MDDVENNAVGGINFPEGFKNYADAQGSLSVNTNLVDNKGKVLNPMSPNSIEKAQSDQASGVGTGAAQPATGLVKAWGVGMTAIVAPELLPSEFVKSLNQSETDHGSKYVDRGSNSYSHTICNE